MQAPGIAVLPAQAEATRLRLLDEGRLRRDLKAMKDGGKVVFPVTQDGDGEYEFEPAGRGSYGDALDYAVPRAFEQMGDIAIVKVPAEQWQDRQEIGEVLRAFCGARAAFHDHGVTGPFRVRRLERIAGDGGPATVVTEHGLRLHVDVSRAYYSPRLADERQRVAGLVRPGERVVDLFGGVAPLGLLCARAGARVVSIDLNPAACELAKKNVAENRLDVQVVEEDARQAAPYGPADRVVMNLPHGAKDFLDVATAIARSGATIHYHEILPDDERADRELSLGVFGDVVRTRHVRTYATGISHIAFDVVVP